MSIVTNSRTETISGSGATIDLTLPNAGLGGIEPVEYADLTNGGANDLSQYDLSHTFEIGYTYFLAAHEIRLSGIGVPFIRLFEAIGGTIRAGATDYWRSQIEASIADIDSNNSGAFLPSSSSNGNASNRFSFMATFYDMMEPLRLSRMDSIGQFYRFGALNRVNISSGHLDVLEAHDGIRIGASAGTFDLGELWIYRIRKPVAP